MNPTAVLDQTIDALRPRFFEMLSDRRAQFQQIRARLAALAGPQDREGFFSGTQTLPALLDDLGFGAHRIVGVAATFGFSTLGTLARTVERTRPAAPTDPRLAQLLAALDDLLAEMTRVLR